MNSISIPTVVMASKRIVRCSARSEKINSFKRAFLNKDKTDKLNMMRKQNLDEIAVSVDQLIKSEIAEMRDIAKEHREFVDGEINEVKEATEGWKILDEDEAKTDEDDDDYFEAEVINA